MIHDAILTLTNKLEVQGKFKISCVAQSTNVVSLVATNISCSAVLEMICSFTKTHIIHEETANSEIIIKISDIPPPSCECKWIIPIYELAQSLEAQDIVIEKMLPLVPERMTSNPRPKVFIADGNAIIISETSNENEAVLSELANELRNQQR